MARGMGIDTAWVSVFEAALTLLNRVPIGTREVSVEGLRLHPDSVDRWLAAWKWKLAWSRSREARYLRTVVAPGMVTADVGANIGLHALVLARLVGTTGHVHAFEPEPRNFLALERAVADAGLDHASLYRVAVGEHTGMMTLHVSDSNRGDHRAAPGLGRRTIIDVERVTLDSTLGEQARLDFVKIDVQGFEVEVLMGMQALVEANPRIAILCELSPALIESNGSDQAQFFAPLQRAGLRTYRLDREARPQEIAAREAWAQALREGYIDVVLQRP